VVGRFEIGVWSKRQGLSLAPRFQYRSPCPSEDLVARAQESEIERGTRALNSTSCTLGADTRGRQMALGESFAGVLEAARVGAEWAWRALYADTAPDLLRYARGSRARDPEDVVGETFLRAVRGLGSFEGDERGFRAWLFTLARNRIVDDHRKLVRRRTEPVPVEVLAEIGPDADAETEAMRALSKDRVRSA